MCRNGNGKPRRLALTSGTNEVLRPRLRGLDERFESRLPPLFKPRTERVREMLPRLYLHGLAQGDFELAEYEAWRTQSLVGLEPVYLWADGVYVKAGLEKDKAALLVVIAALRDGRNVVLAIEPSHRESAASRRSLLRTGPEDQRLRGK